MQLFRQLVLIFKKAVSVDLKGVVNPLSRILALSLVSIFLLALSVFLVPVAVIGVYLCFIIFLSLGFVFSCIEDILVFSLRLPESIKKTILPKTEPPVFSHLQKDSWQFFRLVSGEIIRQDDSVIYVSHTRGFSPILCEHIFNYVGKLDVGDRIDAFYYLKKVDPSEIKIYLKVFKSKHEEPSFKDADSDS